jgi:hypothetical protein
LLVGELPAGIHFDRRGGSVIDPLAPLLELDGVDEAVASARAAIDEAHGHPTNRRGWAATAAEASVRAARASAATDGGSTDIPDEGTVDDPVLAGALRVAESLGPLLPTWQRAPLQTLARLHVLAAADLVSDADELGRPRLSDEGSQRLDLLAGLVTGETKAPAPVLAAVVHGELLALAPFEHANGVVARAATRLTVIGSGLDAKGLVVPEVAFLRAGGRYARLAQGFADGTTEGLRAWLLFCCEALVSGSSEARSIADSAVAD